MNDKPPENMVSQAPDDKTQEQTDISYQGIQTVINGQIERIVADYILSPEEIKQRHIKYLLSKGYPIE